MLSALQAEKLRRLKSATARFTKWADDPIGFVELELLGFLWSKQKDICTSVRDNRRTAVPSCHDVGKSAIAARIAAWWLSTHQPGDAFVVTLAPTFHQVRAVLWREINRLHAAGGLPGETNQTEWWIGGELVAFGRSPADTNPTAIQGIHAPFVLVIFDEACGVGKELWDAADSLIANDNSRFLAIGNPDDPSTEFQEVCKPGSGWNVIELSAFDSPNFTGEPVPDWLRPMLISQIWVEERRKKWGEESPIYQSKVLGKFPQQSTDALIPLKALKDATTRQLIDGDDIELGVDVARFGDDATVIYVRRGMVASRLRKEKKRDLMDVTGIVVQSVKETGAKRVKIDDAGLGGGVTDRLMELKSQGKFSAEVVPINVGEAPRTDQADERFRNLRAELNWAMRTRFVEGRIALVGENDELLSQAGQIKYKYTSAGEIQIEAKADMKKRTKGVSPDDWDALVLAFAEPQFPGASIFKFFQQESGKIDTDPAPQFGYQISGQNIPSAEKYAKVAAANTVRLEAPQNVSQIYGGRGDVYMIGADRIVTVSKDDSGPLIAQGFKEVA